MDPNLLLLITQLITIAFKGAEVGVEEILKLKALLDLSPDVAANIKNALDYSDTTDQDTMDRVNAWLTANGLPTLVPVPAVTTSTPLTVLPAPAADVVPPDPADTTVAADTTEPAPTSAPIVGPGGVLIHGQ